MINRREAVERFNKYLVWAGQETISENQFQSRFDFLGGRWVGSHKKDVTVSIDKTVCFSRPRDNSRLDSGKDTYFYEWEETRHKKEG